MSIYLNHIPVINDVWVINLDRSTGRWKDMVKETQKLRSLKVNRWSAIDGRAMTDDDFRLEKLPLAIRPNVVVAEKQKRRRGEIGCYLSHMKLLKHLAQERVADSHAHLILEDDVLIDRETMAHWNRVKHHLHRDWDMFFLGIHKPVLENSRHGIARVRSINSTHAYMVRHGSIPKILDVMRFMYDPVDEMYASNSDRLNMYAIQPFVIYQKPEVASDINTS
jgi:GR25 family glycosyltransferase involved in LPS biosynthesis